MSRRTDRVIEFTKEALAALPTPEAGEVRWFDAAHRGLMLRIASTGTRTFWYYARVGGKVRKKTIGPVDTFTVAKARTKASEYRAEFENRKPEEATPEAAPHRPTLGEVFEEFIRTRKGRKDTPERNEALRRENRAQFEKYLRLVRNKPVDDIDGLWLEKLHRIVAKPKPGSARKGHPVAANRLLRMLQAMFKRHYRGVRNPVREIRAETWTKERPRRHRFEEHEFRAFLAAIDVYEAEEPGISGSKPLDKAKVAERIERGRAVRRIAGDVLRVAAWTGQRMGNIVAMRWEDVKLPSRTWHIPGESFKDGTPHVAALPAPALDVLKRRWEEQGSPRTGYVFPPGGARGSAPHFVNYHPAWARVLELAGLADKGYRPHDLRATWATLMLEKGKDVLIVSRQLGHRQLTTTERYARQLTNKMRRDVEDVAALLANGEEEAA
ncbi:MAG: integrase family protein [Phycisphaerales bacterium]|nr:integrase family protein [Phycisphaerales bacterium]